MTYPDGEALKRVYESLAAVHDALEVGHRLADLEELVELARTLAKGGPYASTVERFARDHGYAGQRRGPEAIFRPVGPPGGPLRVVQPPPEPHADLPKDRDREWPDQV